MKRIDGRKFNELRPISFETNYIRYPEGSVLVSAGHTKVLCNVTIEEKVPSWMKIQSKKGGWITAEYSMLPRSTHTRTSREAGTSSSRSQEIKRLIGRALRAAIDLEKLGERTCIIDCDVIQADGGTRTASITGGYVALVQALTPLIRKKVIPQSVVVTPVAAISVGILKGKPLLDLCYEEDSAADADANFVLDARGKIIELQGTSEKVSFSRRQFTAMLNLAERGIKQLIKAQQSTLNRSLPL